MKLTHLFLIVISFFIATVLTVYADDILMTGTVTHTKKAGKYTYLTLDQKGKEVWVATTSTHVLVGDVIDYSEALLIENFEAKSFNRTFDKIYFTEGVKIVDGPSLSKDVSLPDDNVHKAIQKENITVTAPAKGEIPKAENGITIEEIYSKLDVLEGKKVVVRARVMKVNKNILGTNWITIQDGTGSAPEDMLIALSSDIAGIADTITISGTIKTGINLGAGYKFKVVIDEASVIK